MGKESLDLDFSLDNLSGAEFANLLDNYQSRDQKHKKGLKISVEPKDLNRTVRELHNKKVSFVVLRREIFEEKERAPKI